MRKFLYQNLPNIITIFRIIFSFLLLLFYPFTSFFYVFYLLGGFTDFLDGFLARKLHLESKIGQVLDSISDFVFMGIVCFKIYPYFQIEKWMIYIFLLIFTIKLITLIIGIVKYKTFCGYTLT